MGLEAHELTTMLKRVGDPGRHCGPLKLSVTGDEDADADEPCFLLKCILLGKGAVGKARYAYRGALTPRCRVLLGKWPWLTGGQGPVRPQLQFDVLSAFVELTSPPAPGLHLPSFSPESQPPILIKIML